MSDGVLWTIIGIVLVIIIAVIGGQCKYDACRKTGLTHDQCVYSVACNG